MGRDLDGVVGVVGGRVAEEVEGPARASRAPHLEAHRGETGHPGQNRSHRGGGVGKQVRVAAVGARRVEGLGDDRRDGVGRGGGVVARVLDDGGARAGLATGPSVGVPYGGSQLDAVSHGDVIQTLVHRLVGVQG